MISKTELIQFIQDHSNNYTEAYLETLPINLLVVLKVEIELKYRD